MWLPGLMEIPLLSSTNTQRLSDSGKMFTFTQNSIYCLVMYQDHIVIYAYSPEDSKEIFDILRELGYFPLHRMMLICNLLLINMAIQSTKIVP